MIAFTIITAFFENYSVQVITLGTALLGAICGMLGTFAVLRKQSLMGDAISHAALPGIAIAFMITGAKDSYVLLLGALICGLIGAFWISAIVKKTHLKSDTALGLILSVFFGFGVLLLSFIQKIPNSNQAGLDKYIFGQAATLLIQDVWLMAIVTGISVVVLLLFWKEFKVILFDSDYTMTLGFNTKIIDRLITFFIVIAIVLGLQTVGVVLMSAMLLAPAAAARQWTNSLGGMVMLAAGFGAVAGVMGTVISASSTNLPTGPIIVLVATTFVLFSFIFSPSRGFIFQTWKQRKNKHFWSQQQLLANLYEYVVNNQELHDYYSIGVAESASGYSKQVMHALVRKNQIIINGNSWALTDQGLEDASKIYDPLYRLPKKSLS